MRRPPRVDPRDGSPGGQRSASARLAMFLEWGRWVTIAYAIVSALHHTQTSTASRASASGLLAPPTGDNPTYTTQLPPYNC
jgi:hypothetical protein